MPLVDAYSYKFLNFSIDFYEWIHKRPNMHRPLFNYLYNGPKTHVSPYLETLAKTKPCTSYFLIHTSKIHKVANIFLLSYKILFILYKIHVLKHYTSRVKKMFTQFFFQIRNKKNIILNIHPNTFIHSTKINCLLWILSFTYQNGSHNDLKNHTRLLSLIIIYTTIPKIIWL